MSKHNYTNPSTVQDLAHVEASVTEGKKYYDEQGWEINAPITDRECIYKALDNAYICGGYLYAKNGICCRDSNGFWRQLSL